METKINIGASITLVDAISKLLYDTSVDPPKERDLPFNIKYKLQRSLALVEKDYMLFTEKRNNIIEEIGVLDEEKSLKRVPDEKIPEFKNTLMDILKTQVSHEFVKLTKEEASSLSTTGVTTDEINVFMISLVEDEELLNSLKTEEPTK